MCILRPAIRRSMSNDAAVLMTTNSSKVAMWCVVAIGLFTSIGWPNTFSLALAGTGVHKSQVSSLLVMAILGGAILPPLQGRIADVTHNRQLAFVVPLFAYAYAAFYGANGHKIGRSNPKN
jgi:FHS family L-fucose permease-like MFS transporter